MRLCKDTPPPELQKAKYIISDSEDSAGDFVVSLGNRNKSATVDVAAQTQATLQERKLPEPQKKKAVVT